MASGLDLLNIKCIDSFMFILIQSPNTHPVFVVFACQTWKAQCFRHSTLCKAAAERSVCAPPLVSFHHTHMISISCLWVCQRHIRPQIFRNLATDGEQSVEEGKWLRALRLCLRCRFLVVPVTCTQSSHRPHTYGSLKPLGHLDRQAEIDKQMEQMITLRGKN